MSGETLRAEFTYTDCSLLVLVFEYALRWERAHPEDDSARMEAAMLRLRNKIAGGISEQGLSEPAAAEMRGSSVRS